MTDAGPVADIEDGSVETRSDDHVCYRCGDRLDGGHWVDLSTHHRGSHAGTYADVSRPCCSDCVAAIGLLDYALEQDTRGSRSVGENEPSDERGSSEARVP